MDSVLHVYDDVMIEEYPQDDVMHCCSGRPSPGVRRARVIIVVINGHGGHQETINTATRR